MRAITQDAPGGPEALHLADVPRPEPLPTEVLVRVHAAGVNPIDWKTRAGGAIYRFLGDPPILGWDVSGLVEAVGWGVHTLEVGDEVIAMPWFPRQAGAYAEYVTAPSRHFARKPASLDHVHAAAVPLAALTAWQSLITTANLQHGQRVLVHAAAGGVGHFAVQIAKAHGAHVIGSASAGKHEFLRELGVDDVVDYQARPFEEVVSDVDVVLDLLGDTVDHTSTRSLDVLRPGGLLIAVPSNLSPDLIPHATQRGLRARGVQVEPDGHALAEIARLIDAGSLRVEVDQVFPLADAAQAHRVGETGRTRGKLVLSLTD
ncbi:NADP-dependent oxidoreductase [Pseudonocardia sp. KRD-182]|uniref:NADP-dependent oxidoreductase n=1 Tax=Pseudonocardia oceani TaxID=2792013 RepID=UPI001C49E126|nr:NADP-dependent oxidoreductase [Pseudonocardia oceani]MBW0110584.1 NADP-dependent oxidoreductase [Pseudonocardia oceani]